MRERNKRKVKPLKNSVVFVALIAMLIVGTGFFLKGIRRVSSEQSIYTLRVMSEEGAQTVSVILQSRTDFLTSVWNSVGRYEGEALENEIRQLENMKELYSFQEVGFVDRNGLAVTSEGEKKDLSEKTWFQRSLAGETCIVKTILNERETAVISIPAARKDQEVSGVMYQVFSMDEFESLLYTGAYDGQALTCLLDLDGNIIMATDGLVYASETNMFDSLLGRSEENAPFVEQIKKDIKEGGSGSGTYMTEAGRRVCYYEPVSLERSGSSWYFVNILPKNVIEAYSNDIIDCAFRLSTVIAVFVLLLSIRTYRMQSAQKEQIEQIAYRDSLTGKDNFHAFKKKFDERKTRDGCFFFMDFEEFKYVNRNYGTERGDEVIRRVGWLLADEVRGEEIAARVSDDKFVYFVPGISEAEAPERCAELKKKISELLKELGVRGTRPVFGICMTDGEELDIERYRSRAILVRRKAKRSGDDFRIYDECEERAAYERQRLFERFETALQENQFEIWYQPKYGLDGEAVCGAEALVRWRTEDGKLIFPGEFIQTLEERGEINRLDAYIFRKVCEQQKRWLEKGMRILPISVNLSRRSLMSMETVQEYKKILTDIGLDPAWVWLEITEDIVDKSVIGAIQALKREGFFLAMDDFGKASSSLANVRRGYFDGIKFDKSLIDLIGKKDETILRYTIPMMREMGMVITAEGVETKEQVEFLRELRCDQIQGYYFYRPMMKQLFERMLETGTEA